jgi:hypothetical protein
LLTDSQELRRKEMLHARVVAFALCLLTSVLTARGGAEQIETHLTVKHTEDDWTGDEGQLAQVAVVDTASDGSVLTVLFMRGVIENDPDSIAATVMFLLRASRLQEQSAFVKVKLFYRGSRSDTLVIIDQVVKEQRWSLGVQRAPTFDLRGKNGYVGRWEVSRPDTLFAGVTRMGVAVGWINAPDLSSSPPHFFAFGQPAMTEALKVISYRFE